MWARPKIELLAVPPIVKLSQNRYCWPRARFDCVRALWCQYSQLRGYLTLWLRLASDMCMYEVMLLFYL